MVVRASMLRFLLQILASVAVAMTLGCAGKGSSGQHPYTTTVQLDGSQEVPRVTTAAKGKGELTVLPDQTLSGRVIVSDVIVTAAHIHSGAAGKNGPVVITLKKTSDNTLV